MMAIDMDLSAGGNGRRRRRLARVRSVLSAWLGRVGARRALAAVDDRALRRTGPTRCGIAAEIARWRRRA